MATSPRFVTLSPTSPLAQTTKKTARDLADHLKKLQEYHAAIGAMKAVLARNAYKPVQWPIDATNPILVNLVRKYPQGYIQVDRRLISSLDSQYRRSLIQDTKKLVTAMTKRVRRARRTGGFSSPRVFSDEIIAFFQGANLPAFGQNNIMDLMSFTQDSIATQTIMTNLLTVYAYHTADPPLPYNAQVNRDAIDAGVVNSRATIATGVHAFTAEEVASIQQYPNVGLSTDTLKKMGVKINRQFMGVDQYMATGLANALQIVMGKANQPKKGARPVGTTEGGIPIYRPKDIHKTFDPSNFRFSSFQSIGAAEVIADPAQWTDDQKAKLGYDPSTGKAAGMPPDEKAAYEMFVIPAENQAKEELKVRKKQDKNALPADLDYNALGQQMANRVGHSLTAPTMTQLTIDGQRRLATQYLAYVKGRSQA